MAHHHPTLSDFFKRLGFIKKEEGTKDKPPLNPCHKAILSGPEMEPPEMLLAPSEELSFSYKGRMMPPFLSRCALASAVTWVLLALCSASFLYLGKSLFPCKINGGPPKPPLPERMDIETALKNLDEATSELLRTWDGVSSQTQNAFKQYFLPKGATGKPGEGPLEGIMDGVPGGPLAVYLHHVGTVKVLAETVKKGRKEKRKAALLRRIKIVKTIIQLATQRLRGLDESGNFALNNKIFSAVNGVELELPSSEELADAEGEQTNYDEYQEMVKGIGTFRSPPETTITTVPWPLAKKLVDTLRLKEMHLNANQNIISSLQIAIPFIYGEEHDWIEDGTGPIKGVLLGPLPVPERPPPTHEMVKGPLPAPTKLPPPHAMAKGPRPVLGPRPVPLGPLIDGGGVVVPPEGPPGKGEDGGAPQIPPPVGGEGPTEVPLSYFKQLMLRFSYLGIEEMGRLQRERRLPMDWTAQAAVEHLNEISNSQQEYADAVIGLKDTSLKEWETELGKLAPFDLAVMALRLM